MSTSSFWSGSVRGGAPSAQQAASLAAMTAAGNLFDKVVHALRQGDEARARRMAAQVAARPFDEHEGLWPGPQAAHYALFELVTDTVEDWPEDDQTWLDALTELAAQVSGRQRDELRHLAAVLHHDATILGVGELEARRLRELADGADPMALPSDEVPAAERADYVLDLARLVLVTQQRIVADWA